MHEDERHPPRFALSPSSGVPLYRQLMDAVRAEIAQGRPPAGELLPSVRVVARELEINPMTVSKAYSLLEAEGAVERVRGQGMRVRAVDPGGSAAERRQALRPLAEQLAARARQLGLRRSDVRELLDPYLEDLLDD